MEVYMVACTAGHTGECLEGRRVENVEEYLGLACRVDLLEGLILLENWEVVCRVVNVVGLM
jgi:hypothetical protein